MAKSCIGDEQNNMAAKADPSLSTCPFCNASIESTEIERHVNDHLRDETLDRDLEFAHQLACAPESPISNLVDSEVHADETLCRDLELAHQLVYAPESSPANIANDHVHEDMSYINGCGNNFESIPLRHDSESRDGAHQLDESTHGLTCNPTRSEFYKVKGGLMALLKKRLQLSDSTAQTSLLSGYVDHFESTQSEDQGWGCGWRNIQMLCSHLLVHRPETIKVLFGGSGFVPDISSLQRWLELAWEKGFDTVGSKQFNNKIYGTKKWIGTTECATLLRSFGLRARLVDFVDGAQCKRKGIQISGLMDRCLIGNAHDPTQLSTAIEGKSSCSSISSQDNVTSRGDPKPDTMDKRAQIEFYKQQLESVMLSVGRAQGRKTSKRCKMKDSQFSELMKMFLVTNGHDPTQSSTTNEGESSCSSISSQDNFTCGEDPNPDTMGYQALVEWIWNYFYDECSTESSKGVIVTEKAPLYFQHDGHSRTIIGIQVKHHNNGKPQYTLLILDPIHRTQTLEKLLKRKVGWQSFIKRGIHTLNKPQYQLLYVDPGIAEGEEADQLKIIDSLLLSFIGS